jgi:mannose-6-phosphate isomerase-like protein (cupin superfamily)
MPAASPVGHSERTPGILLGHAPEAVVTPSTAEIELAIQDLVNGAVNGHSRAVLHAAGLEALPFLARYLAADSAIDVLERFEAILKSLLLDCLTSEVTGPTARRLARFQQELGFLYKYKSYAVKCATPLGYSVFLQREGEGFSFQRHVARKTEVFHVLGTTEGAYAFVCHYDDWARVYEPAAFAAWLAGSPDPRYDRYRFQVEPGDFFVMDQLNVVHTVVGCVLEEFATVSTDMVDRLHDQNAGHPIPAEYDRRYAEQRLRTLTFPPGARLLAVDGPSTRATPVEPVPMRGCTKVPLTDSFVVASRYLVHPLGTTDVLHDDERAAILHVTAGSGQVVVADRDEIGFANPPSLSARKADVLLIAPGIRYAFVNDGDEPLELSEHRITPEAALA